MKIAILGWGSLIKEPRDLPIVGDWQPDGPKLWIEFSRISQRGARAGCLTLVIDERCQSEVTTLHVLSKRGDLPQAIADLQEREGTSQDGIGFADSRRHTFCPQRHEPASQILRTHPRLGNAKRFRCRHLDRARIEFQGYHRRPLQSCRCLELLETAYPLPPRRTR